MNQSKILKEGTILITAYITLLVLSLLVPLMIIPGIILLPIPFVIFSSKYNWKPSLLMLLIVTFLTLFFATAITLPLTVLVGFGGIMLGVSIHHNLTPYETWARGTIGFIAGLLFVFVFSHVALQINWVTELSVILNESLQLSQELLEQFGTAEQSEAQMKALEEQILLLIYLMPAGIAIISIFFAFTSQWASYKFINRIRNKQLKFPPIRILQFPVAVVWIYFFALILTFIDLEPNGVVYLVVHNVLTLSGLFLVLQGLSFAFFYADHKGRTNVLPILLVVITVLLPFILLYLVRILGIIDIGYKLRDRLTNKEK